MAKAKQSKVSESSETSPLESESGAEESGLQSSEELEENKNETEASGTSQESELSTLAERTVEEQRKRLAPGTGWRRLVIYEQRPAEWQREIRQGDEATFKGRDNKIHRGQVVSKGVGVVGIKSGSEPPVEVPVNDVLTIHR